jgi:hypothetical protein
MAQKLIATITFLIISLSLVQAAKKPKWVKERPNDPSSYFGIAMVPKTNGTTDYTERARSQALQQLSSEIKINISSKSLLHQFENNYELKQEFESKIHTSVTQTLEGYEVQTWEDKNEYWVMMRLPKAKYELTRRMNLDKAKKLAALYCRDAKKSAEQYQITSALTLYVKAINSIRNHLDEDLTYRDFDGDLNVGTEIFNGIRQVFRNLEIKPAQPVYKLQLARQVDVPVTLHAMFVSPDFGRIPVENLPIEFYFSKGDGDLFPQRVTQIDGSATCNISRFISKRRAQEITAIVDAPALFHEAGGEHTLLKLFFPPEIMPRVAIPIEVEKSKAYFIADETVFGNETNNSIFTNAIKSELSDNFFNFTTLVQDADYLIRLQSRFTAGDEKRGNGYSIFLVYGDFTITIENIQRQMEVFADGVSNVKGIKTGDYEHALKDCRQKLQQYFSQTIVSKLEQVDL